MRVSSIEHTAVVADGMQADYYRELLAAQRSDLAAELSALVRRLTHAMTAGAGDVGRLRRSIRNAEREMRAIDRMTSALEQRFPARPAATAGV